jgi:hypothetical protein
MQLATPKWNCDNFGSIEQDQHRRDCYRRQPWPQWRKCLTNKPALSEFPADPNLVPIANHGIGGRIRQSLPFPDAFRTGCSRIF